MIMLACRESTKVAIIIERITAGVDEWQKQTNICVFFWHVFRNQFVFVPKIKRAKKKKYWDESDTYTLYQTYLNSVNELFVVQWEACLNSRCCYSMLASIKIRVVQKANNETNTCTCTVCIIPVWTHGLEGIGTCRHVPVYQWCASKTALKTI